ncbi:hypothetical protein F4679DRAFT_588940 [Xylaria curta]|nr:hypothetical protein F4679DRAFT_588940 [Xylaria curta]
MNDTSIVNFLVDEFQCHICFDLLDDPRPACAWGHVFCKECLRQHSHQNRRDNRYPLCPICRDPIIYAIEGRILGCNEGLMRTTKIVEQLRQRVVRLPPRDIGLQTDVNLTRSTGQQTHLSSTGTTGQQTENLLSWDNGREPNADLPENLMDLLEEDEGLASGSGLSDNQPGGSQEYVVDHGEDRWQGMVALRRWHEEYENRAVPVNVDVEWVDEEQDARPDLRVGIEAKILGYWRSLTPKTRGWVKFILKLVGLRILLRVAADFARQRRLGRE